MTASEEGFRRSWVSTALIWSAAVRRLIDSHQFAETQLAFVALFLCVNNMRDLTAGRGSVSADEVAAADCPLDADELDRQCERLRVIRGGILHLSGNVTVSWSTGAPPLTIKTTTRGRGKSRRETMDLGEVESLLDRLDPWIRGSYERMVLGVKTA